MIEERYATAVVADTLADTSASLDAVAAAGMASTRRGTGFALWRLTYDGDATGLAECRGECARWLARYCKARSIAAGPGERLEVADLVLAWLVAGVCPSCQGRGYRTVPGAPTLSDQACPACKGDGKRPLASTLAERWPAPAWQLDAGRWLHGELLDLEGATRHAYAKRMGRNTT